jgi:hypothetical protein
MIKGIQRKDHICADCWKDKEIEKENFKKYEPEQA